MTCLISVIVCRVRVVLFLIRMRRRLLRWSEDVLSLRLMRTTKTRMQQKSTGLQLIVRLTRTPSIRIS